MPRTQQSTPKTVAAGVALALLVMTKLAAAMPASSNFEEDFDDKDKPWTEIAIQLPAPPATENLLPFYVSPTATQTFAVDAKSLTVGSDGVVRYTLVAKSEEGATSISYEGIRCQSHEKKLYAFGHPDGSWARSRRDQWEPILDKGINRQHSALARDYFCQESIVAGDAQQIVQRLRAQHPLSPLH